MMNTSIPEVLKSTKLFKEYITPVVYVSTDSLFPVYTYVYDPDTNILTQYKNGVESVRMFVPDKFSLKESL